MYIENGADIITTSTFRTQDYWIQQYLKNYQDSLELYNQKTIIKKAVEICRNAIISAKL